MEEIRLTYLFQKHTEGLATETEKQELFYLMSKPENEQYVTDLIEHKWNEIELGKKIFSREKSEAILKEILLRAEKLEEESAPVYELPSKKGYSIWARIAIAASIVFVIGISFYFFLQQKPDPETAKVNSGDDLLQNNKVASIVLPGSNKALLTLADGTIINLDSSASGELTQQGAAKVKKLQDGQLVYSSSETQSKEIFYNSVSTPNGGQYKIKLSDGTAVWLNAASSIKYPSVFTGSERLVEITGEVYFEVEKNERMPFIVTAKNIQVTVLGTHFNINAYSDESSIKTTLLEGSVNVKTGAKSKLLKPGEQAVLGRDGQLRAGRIANTDEVIAWKNGMFHFSKASSLESVMKQLARWYDVTIEYKGKIPAQSFGGEVSRSSNLTEVLEILKASGVNSRLEGRTIVVGK